MTPKSDDLSKGFWTWFFRGLKGKPGFRKLLDRWIVFHSLVGFLFATLVKVPLMDASSSILLPLVSIFVGLSFAWAGNAQSILQTEEMEDVTNKHPDGTQNYVYTFQTSVLIILVNLCIWGIAGLKVFDESWPTSSHPKMYYAIKAFAFLWSSMTIRECWQLVQAVNTMLVVRVNVKKNRK